MVRLEQSSDDPGPESDWGIKGNYVLVIALLYVYMLNPPGSGVIKKPIGHEMTGDMAVSYKLLT